MEESISSVSDGCDIMLVKYILRLHSPANQEPEIGAVFNEAGGVSQRCHMNLSCVKIETTP